MDTFAKILLVIGVILLVAAAVLSLVIGFSPSPDQVIMYWRAPTEAECHAWRVCAVVQAVCYGAMIALNLWLMGRGPDKAGLIILIVLLEIVSIPTIYSVAQSALWNALV